MDRMFPLRQGRITSGYGSRTLKGVYNNHRGIDIVSNDPFQTVLCPVTGICIVKGYSKTFGNRVWIKVAEKEYYVLAHLEYISPNVFEGKKVLIGSTIGRIGNTGLSFGRHLHWEFRTDPANPETAYYSNCLIF